jgi:predicted ABC-type ATPase
MGARDEAFAAFADRVFENLAKHGDHDQTTHGNWARGGSEYQAGGVEPSGKTGMPPLPNEYDSRSLALHYTSDGNLAPERQALHDKIVSDAVAGHKAQARPRYHLMGGGTACGKSTLIDTGFVSLPDDHVAVNPDKIHNLLPEYMEIAKNDPDGAAAFFHEEASYLAKRIVAEAQAKSLNVTLDGTGDGGLSYITGKIEAARAAGYEVTGTYADLPVELAIKISNARAEAGEVINGELVHRVVPESVLRQTHAGVAAVFQVAPMFDRVDLYDTTAMGKPVLMAKCTRGQPVTVVDQTRYNTFLAKAGGSTHAVAKAGPARTGREALSTPGPRKAEAYRLESRRGGVLGVPGQGPGGRQGQRLANVSPSPVGKHYQGQHDQADHGNWSQRGGEGPARLTHTMAAALWRQTAVKHGATYSVTNKSSRIRGMSVSPYEGRGIVLPPGKGSHDDMVEFTKANADLLAKPGHYLGPWYDSKTGEVCLDVSIVVSSDAEARALCEQHNQRAYYDLEKDEEVWVDEEATGSRITKASGGVKFTLFRVPDPQSGLSRQQYEAICESIGLTPSYSEKKA